MKKAAMCIVSLLIICGLMTGCGGSASKFAGSYKGTVDMTDVYRQDFEDFTGVPSEASCSVEVSLTLAEEDKQQTFTMSAGRKSSNRPSLMRLTAARKKSSMPSWRVWMCVRSSTPRS